MDDKAIEMQQSWIHEMKLEEDCWTVKFSIPHAYGEHTYSEDFEWSRDYPPPYLKEAAAKFMEAITRATNERVALEQKVPCETCTSHCCRYFDTIRVRRDDAIRFIDAGVDPTSTMILWDGLAWPDEELKPQYEGFGERLKEWIRTVPPVSMDGTIGFMKKVPWTAPPGKEPEPEAKACTLLRETGCSVYEHRPQICREFPALPCDIYDEDPQKKKGLVQLRAKRERDAVL